MHGEPFCRHLLSPPPGGVPKNPPRPAYRWALPGDGSIPRQSARDPLWMPARLRVTYIGPPLVRRSGWHWFTRFGRGLLAWGAIGPVIINRLAHDKIQDEFRSLLSERYLAPDAHRDHTLLRFHVGQGHVLADCSARGRLHLAEQPSPQSEPLSLGPLKARLE